MRAMRDTFLEELYQNMLQDEKIFFLSADFGSPVLDKIRNDIPQRFINVGIAEQNLINVAVGLGLEGFKVYVYAIAPFVTMRCFEQIRVNISILSQIRNMNINIIGVGAGISYNMSGPTHHCLEDLSIISTLPNIDIFSCSDFEQSKNYVNYSLKNNFPKYIRFDSKALDEIKIENDFDKGFRILKNSEKVAIISTGFMSHKALKLENVKVIDLFLVNNFNIDELLNELKDIKTVFTLEESFGGLDTIINSRIKDKKIVNLKFNRVYNFEIGDREYIHSLHNLSLEEIKEKIEEYL